MQFPGSSLVTFSVVQKLKMILSITRAWRNTFSQFLDFLILPYVEKLLLPLVSEFFVCLAFNHWFILLFFLPSSTPSLLKTGLTPIRGVFFDIPEESYVFFSPLNEVHYTFVVLILFYFLRLVNESLNVRVLQNQLSWSVSQPVFS